MGIALSILELSYKYTETRKDGQGAFARDAAVLGAREPNRAGAADDLNAFRRLLGQVHLFTGKLLIEQGDRLPGQLRQALCGDHAVHPATCQP